MSAKIRRAQRRLATIKARLAAIQDDTTVKALVTAFIEKHLARKGSS